MRTGEALEFLMEKCKVTRSHASMWLAQARNSPDGTESFRTPCKFSVRVTARVTGVRESGLKSWMYVIDVIPHRES